MVNPQIGEIRKGRDIGYANPSRNFIYAACLDCGKGRWVLYLHGKSISPRCYSCANKRSGQEQKENRLGERNPTWKGGRLKRKGYILVKIFPVNPYYPMADKKGYVFEHRLMMAKKLGRCLSSSEQVHHKDGKRDHNTEQNLELTKSGWHKLSYTSGYQQGYQDCARVKQAEMEKQIRLLQWHVKELIKQLQGRLLNDF